MKWFPKLVYNIIKSGIKTYLDTFLEFKVWGKENIPEGPNIYCSNHFSSTDPFFVITLMKEPVHMVIGPGFSVPVVKHILRSGEQINALPENRQKVIPHAVEFLKQGESIYIFPEGDLNDQQEFLKFYTGMARIYMECPVNIIPIGIVSPRRYVKDKESNIKVGETVYRTLAVFAGKYFANIGKPLRFEELEKSPDKENSVNYITEYVRKAIEELITDIKVNKFWN